MGRVRKVIGYLLRGALTALGIPLAVMLAYVFFLASVLWFDAHLRGVRAVDVFWNGTLDSHLLLQDGYASFRFKDEAAHRKAERRLRQLFLDRDQRRGAIEWGRRLCEVARRKHLLKLEAFEELTRKHGFKPDDEGWRALHRAGVSLGDLRPGKEKILALRALSIDDGLAAHCAYRRLLAHPGTRDEDLGRLEKAVQAALPDVEDQKALIAWARARRTQLHVARPLRVSPELALTVPYEVRPPAPDSAFFDAWILWEDWNVADAMLEAREAQLVELLGGPRLSNGRSSLATLRALGEEAINDRTDAFPLPFANRNHPQRSRAVLIAAIDRLSGLDPSLGPIREVAEVMLPNVFVPGAPSGAIWDDVRIPETDGWASLVWLASDDTAITMLDNRRRLGRIKNSTTHLPYRIEDLRLYPDYNRYGADGAGVSGILTGLLAGLSWISFLGIRFLTVTFLGLVLGLWPNPTFQRVREAEERFTYVHLAVVIVTVFVSWPITLWVLEPRVALYSENIWAVLSGVALSSALGGATLEAVKNLSTLLFLRLGYDVSVLWRDEILAGAVTVVLLLNLESSAVGILSAMLIGLLSPWTLEKLRGAEEAPPEPEE